MIENNGIKNEYHKHVHKSGGSLWDNLFKFLSRNKKNKVTKEDLRILFIDDNKFPVIENLKKAGYIVNWRKDIKKIDDADVVDAHILFIDYRGVGKNLSPKEGIGVCKMLKDKYKESKFIVLCTGEDIPNDLLKEIKNISDSIVNKTDVSDFFYIIDSYISS